MRLGLSTNVLLSPVQGSGERGVSSTRPLRPPKKRKLDDAADTPKNPLSRNSFTAHMYMRMYMYNFIHVIVHTGTCTRTYQYFPQPKKQTKMIFKSIDHPNTTQSFEVTTCTVFMLVETLMHIRTCTNI